MTSSEHRSQYKTLVDNLCIALYGLRPRCHSVWKKCDGEVIIPLNMVLKGPVVHFDSGGHYKHICVVSWSFIKSVSWTIVGNDLTYLFGNSVSIFQVFRDKTA